LTVAIGRCFADDAPVLTPPGQQAAGGGILLTTSRASRPAVSARLQGLPVAQVTATFQTEHGPRRASYEGPLLWTVLTSSGVVDASKPRDQVRQTVLLTGRDGYSAVLALGEISPEFEGKQVVVAKFEDGRPLDPEHYRVVVPGDIRGGRSVRDVVRIMVLGPEPGNQ
jgi:hypothetical protein